MAITFTSGNDDFCTIRRDMISEHIMEREGNIYIEIKERDKVEQVK